MNYLQKKKLAFMSIANSVKGFIRTITGVFPLTLTNCVDEESITDYSIYGNSVQNGTPTPDTPVEVECVGEYDAVSGKYKIPITVGGKNLIANWNAGWCTAQGVLDTANYPNRRYTDFIPINPNTSYYVSGGGTNSNWTVYDENYNYLYGQIFGSTRGIKHSSAKYVRLAHTNSNVGAIQLEEGRTATEYEPYHEPITTNIYLDEPLRKVGNYADYIDFEDGKVVRNVKTVALQKADAQYSWISKKGVAFKNVLSENLNRAKGLCNRENLFTANGGETTTMWLGVESKWVYWIGILDYLGMTTIDEFNEWLANNPTYVYYGTDNPTETLITLPNIPTFKGTSILTVGTTTQPSNAEVTYYSTLKE